MLCVCVCVCVCVRARVIGVTHAAHHVIVCAFTFVRVHEACRHPCVPEFSERFAFLRTFTDSYTSYTTSMTL